MTDQRLMSDIHHGAPASRTLLSDEHYLEMRKILQMTSLAVREKLQKRILQRQKSMKLPAKKGRSNYRR